jgi:hypothetical protein
MLTCCVKEAGGRSVLYYLTVAGETLLEAPEN